MGKVKCPGVVIDTDVIMYQFPMGKVKKKSKYQYSYGKALYQFPMGKVKYRD